MILIQCQCLDRVLNNTLLEGPLQSNMHVCSYASMCSASPFKQLFVESETRFDLYTSLDLNVHVRKFERVGLHQSMFLIVKLMMERCVVVTLSHPFSKQFPLYVSSLYKAVMGGGARYAFETPVSFSAAMSCPLGVRNSDAV